MMTRRGAGLGLLAMTLVFSSGCWLFVGAAGAGAGAVWYYGALRSTEDADHRVVFEAGRKALDDLEIPVQAESIDATAGTLEGETADGKQVVISVKYLTEQTSELIIRVGLADERRARMIYEKLEAHLPAGGKSADG